MNSVKPFEDYPFVMEEKSRSLQRRAIYCHSNRDNMFHLVTPPYMGVESVKTIEVINILIQQGKMIQYKKSSNIHKKINDAWDSWDEEWDFCDDHFSVRHNTDLKDAPWHHEFGTPIKIGYHQGKLVWVSEFIYSPKVKYTKFISMNEKPNWSKFGFTNINNIRPVFSKNMNHYI